MILRTTVLASVLSAAIAGCATTPRSPAEDVKVASQYGHGDSAANHPTEPLLPSSAAVDESGPWWEGFGDPRLDRLVNEVLVVNRDLVVAGLRLRQARARAGLAETDLWPSVSASVRSSVSRDLAVEDDSTRVSHSADLSVSYEVDLWGRLRAQRDVAQWEAEATAQDLSATALVLVGRTLNLYWDLAYLNQRIDSGDANLARLERTLELVTVQYEAGHVSRIEFREAEQNLVSQRSAQSALEQQRVEVRNALTVLLDGTPWPVSDEPRNLAAISPGVAPGLPAELLARRPDLQAAELRLRQERSRVDITRLSYLPSISLTGSAGNSSDSLRDLLANPTVSLGVGISLPFLNVRQMQLDNEVARLDYEIVANNFRTTLYTAFTEVDDALSAKEKLARQVALSAESVEAARDIERMYEVRYRAGAAALRTWLDAQQTLRNAELDLAAARLGLLRNDVLLFQALGGTGS